MASDTNGNGNGRAADDLFQTLASDIQSGRLAEGSPLPPEREIVETYGVSRTVAREAVQALANRGLVEARPRFRPIVRKPGYDTAVDTLGSVVGHLLNQPGGVRNMFDTRILIEAALVRQAATSATRDDLARLKGALEANGDAVDDSEEFYRTDMAFHQALFHIPGNPVLPAIHKAYVTWLSPHWLQMPRLPERNKENFRAHSAIFEAILMRDPDAAEGALRDHLGYAWTQVEQTFSEGPPSPDGSTDEN